MHHIDILPAVEADIPRLAEIHVHAFRDDLAIRLRFSSDEEHYHSVVAMIEKQIQDPKTRVAMAIETSTNRIVGFAIWLQFDGTEKEEPLPHSQHRHGEGRTMSEVIAQSSRYMRRHWMTGKKYTLLNTLVVCPLSQRHGVGSALVRYGAARADAAGLVSYVKSSPVAHKLYENTGWRDVGTLDLDLSEWGGKARGWGVYTFTYMIRIPSLLGS